MYTSVRRFLDLHFDSQGTVALALKCYGEFSLSVESDQESAIRNANKSAGFRS